jgi:hypothetical protein
VVCVGGRISLQPIKSLMMGNKRDNTGQPYELLVQGIFQAIHDQKKVSNIIIEHNKTLKGKTITHQIDVYWKFEQVGIPHEVVVQAKDWETAVNQGQLLQFKGVLDDLPNQPRGVFVTRTGYQQGAKDFTASFFTNWMSLQSRRTCKLRRWAGFCIKQNSGLSRSQARIQMKGSLTNSRWD